MAAVPLSDGSHGEQCEGSTMFAMPVAKPRCGQLLRAARHRALRQLLWLRVL